VRDNITFVANAPGDAVVAGPAGFAAAIEILSSGGDVNFAGVSGLNDLDISGAASKATVETWTVLNGAVAPLEFRDVDLVAEVGAENPPGAFARPGDPNLSGPVKIGAILSLSGAGVEQAAATRDAMQLAVDEINSAGGIYGQDMELVVQNDGGGADGALSAADALRSEGVTAIIGPLADGAAAAVRGAWPQDSAVPVLALSPSAALAGIGNPAFFRVTPSSTIETVVLANLARERDQSVACVLYEDGDGQEEMAEAFRVAFERKDGRVRKPVAAAEGADYAALLADCTAR
jgi:ABC-type branched-subunit amino acid transport system substrate-binding protein